MVGLEVHPAWWPDADLTLAAARTAFRYGPGEDRATGYLYGDGQRCSPALATEGDRLLEGLDEKLGLRYSHVAFQAYRNGSGCDWHTDAFNEQAVLSLGASRRLGIRRPGGDPQWTTV